MKRAILMLTVVTMIVAVTAFARNNVPGDVSVPTDLTSTINPGDPPDVPATITFDWVPGVEAKPAEKYSLDIYGVVLVDGIIDPDPVDDEVVEWSVSFGSSDPTLTIPLEDLHDAIFAAIDEAITDAGITEVTDVVLSEMYAKVKPFGAKLRSRSTNASLVSCKSVLSLFSCHRSPSAV